MKIVIEIRPAEGGADAKDLMEIQARVYLAYAKRHGLIVETTHAGGWIALVVSGDTKTVARLLAETGGHRWQRVPPSERHGRVHTSTVTVAAYALAAREEASVVDGAVRFETCRAGGKGGQHQNVTESCVVAVHVPTGIRARIANERSQHANKRLALQVLRGRVEARKSASDMVRLNAVRRSQIGSGQRGDKRRTYRAQDDRVLDHVTGCKASLTKVVAGHLELLG